MGLVEPALKVQFAVPPGTFVKLAPRLNSALRSTPPTPVAEPLAPCAVPSNGPVKPVTLTVAVAGVMVMLLASVLPSWLPSPANVAVAVHPLAAVTLTQSPLGTTGTVWFNAPAPVTFAVAVNAEPR